MCLDGLDLFLSEGCHQEIVRCSCLLVCRLDNLINGESRFLFLLSPCAGRPNDLLVNVDLRLRSFDLILVEPTTLLAAGVRLWLISLRNHFDKLHETG